ncbi:MAG: fructosamine kinase family protein [Chitinophagaceae bacterium]|nr:fructosamine kinase family protein [Chitinophagaceae bacterium]
MTLSSSVKACLKRVLKTDEFAVQSVGGGCINQTYKLTLKNKRRFFCKVNVTDKLPGLFEKERNGLGLLRKQYSIKVPEVVDVAVVENEQIILLEWITSGKPHGKFWVSFGKQLAALHHASASYFGLNENNYMGSVLQINSQKDNWIEFFIENRLQPLIKQCVKINSLPASDVRALEKLYIKLSEFFSVEKPSLLHGDLWNGNFMCNENNEPVLIDPAVYYGHRSVDIGMTTLFGGFSNGFYESYNYHFAFPVNYKEQWKICNLYPLLIHLLLFGRSYLPQIQQTLKYFS